MSLPEDSTPPPSTIEELTEQEIALLKRLSRSGQDTEVGLIVRKALSPRPIQNERKKKERENQAYYREEYAKEIIPLLHRLSDTKKSMALRKRDYPQYTMETVYTRVNQSICYAVDHLDDKDRTLAKIREKFKLCLHPRHKPDKVLFQYLGAMEVATKLVLYEHNENASFQEVRDMVNQFIEQGKSGQKLIIPCEGDEVMEEFLPFSLSEEELAEIKALVQPCLSLGMVAIIEIDKIFLGKSGVEKV